MSRGLGIALGVALFVGASVWRAATGEELWPTVIAGAFLVVIAVVTIVLVARAEQRSPGWVAAGAVRGMVADARAVPQRIKAWSRAAIAPHVRGRP